MIITLDVRIEGGTHTEIVTYSGSAEDCIAYLSGFLCNGLIVDSMKVMK